MQKYGVLIHSLASSDRSINLCILRNACHELFCVLRDFYASGTQDAEVTKSLTAQYNSLPYLFMENYSYQYLILL